MIGITTFEEKLFTLVLAEAKARMREAGIHASDVDTLFEFKQKVEVDFAIFLFRLFEEAEGEK